MTVVPPRRVIVNARSSALVDPASSKANSTPPADADLACAAASGSARKNTACRLANGNSGCDWVEGFGTPPTVPTITTSISSITGFLS